MAATVIGTINISAGVQTYAKEDCHTSIGDDLGWILVESYPEEPEECKKYNWDKITADEGESIHFNECTVDTVERVLLRMERIRYLVLMYTIHSQYHD